MSCELGDVLGGTFDVSRQAPNQIHLSGRQGGCWDVFGVAKGGNLHEYTLWCCRDFFIRMESSKIRFGLVLVIQSAELIEPGMRKVE